MRLYINANIITCDEQNFENGYILTEGCVIKSVGQVPPDLPGVPVVDLADKTVCPGLVDAHSHIGIFGNASGFEGMDGNESTDPVTPHIRAIDGINPFDACFADALRGGVTTVVTGPGSANPIGGTFAAIKTLGSRVDNMIVKDPAAMKISFGENPKRVYGQNGKTPKTRMATAALIREALFRAREYSATSFDIKSEALCAVLSGRLIVKAHAHRADDIFTALRIAKEFGLKMTIEHCTEGHLIAKELKAEGVSVCIGPLFGDRGKPELINKTFETISVLAREGVPFAIISDHPENPAQELLTCACMAAKNGISRELALKAVTIEAARICGIDGRVGSLREGKDADFCILSAHPIDFSARVEAVVIMGEKVNIA